MWLQIIYSLVKECDTTVAVREEAHVDIQERNQTITKSIHEEVDPKVTQKWNKWNFLHSIALEKSNSYYITIGGRYFLDLNYYFLHFPFHYKNSSWNKLFIM